MPPTDPETLDSNTPGGDGRPEPSRSDRRAASPTDDGVDERTEAQREAAEFGGE